VRRLSLGFLVVIGSVASSLLMVPATHKAHALDGQGENQGLRACVEQKRRLDVQLLVDESASLRDSDPDDLRVNALKSVADVLRNLVDVSQSSLDITGGQKPLVVYLMVSGFGSGFEVRLPFTEVTDDNHPAILEALEAQRPRNRDKHTRYHIALSEAGRQFIEFTDIDSGTAGAESTCRMLLWFSDGDHDDDDDPYVTPRELRQINEEVCGPSGIVDGLRRNGVYLFGVGLKPDDANLETMQRITKGDVGEPCGQAPATGGFSLASRTNLVSTILANLDVPGSPDEAIELEACEGELPCGEIRFTVEDFVESFTILATRPNSEVELKVVTNTEEARVILPGGSEDEVVGSTLDVLKWEPLHNEVVLITARRRSGSPISGEWVFAFNGPDASQSKGSVSFIGNANVAVITESGEDVSDPNFVLNRSSLPNLNLEVQMGASQAVVERVLADFRIGDFQSRLETADRGNGAFRISRSAVTAALEDPDFIEATQVDLFIYPTGVIEGVTTIDGNPVDVDFAPRVIPLVVSVGERFPTFLGAQGDLKFTGTENKTVEMRFRGPQAGSAEVNFINFVPNDQNAAQFEIVRQDPCVVPELEQMTCTIEIAPTSQSFGAKQLDLTVEYQSQGDSSVTEPAQLRFSVETRKTTNTAGGIRTAAALLGLFLLVQGLVRWMIASLVTNYLALTPASKRVRFSATVDSSGAVSLVDLGTTGDPSRETFTAENLEKTKQFSAFGYDFSCSVLQTFLHQTDTPVGVVNSPAEHCFGPGGTQTSSDTGLQKGLLSLSLRRQWLISISDAAVGQMAVGATSSAVASVIAFFDPYETRSRNEQISNLEIELASGNFADEFLRFLDSFRERVENESATPSDAPEGEIEPSSSFMVDSSDPFAGSSIISAVVSEVGDSDKPRRRGRGGVPNSVDTNLEETIDPLINSDPFRS
jgi:hypothetical protein